MAVANDAYSFATDFVATVGGLALFAREDFDAAIGELAGQSDDVRDDKITISAGLPCAPRASKSPKSAPGLQKAHGAESAPEMGFRYDRPGLQGVVSSARPAKKTKKGRKTVEQAPGGKRRGADGTSGAEFARCVEAERWRSRHHALDEPLSTLIQTIGSRVTIRGRRTMRHVNMRFGGSGMGVAAWR